MGSQPKSTPNGYMRLVRGDPAPDLVCHLCQALIFNSEAHNIWHEINTNFLNGMSIKIDDLIELHDHYIEDE